MTDNPGRKKMISSYLTTSEKITRIHETQMYLEGEEGSVILFMYEVMLSLSTMNLDH